MPAPTSSACQPTICSGPWQMSSAPGTAFSSDRNSLSDVSLWPSLLALAYRSHLQSPTIQWLRSGEWIGCSKMSPGSARVHCSCPLLVETMHLFLITSIAFNYCKSTRLSLSCSRLAGSDQSYLIYDRLLPPSQFDSCWISTPAAAAQKPRFLPQPVNHALFLLAW